MTLFVVAGVLTFISISSAQFSEKTFEQSCSNPSVLCFGTSVLDPTFRHCTKNCDLAVSIFEDKRSPSKVRFQLFGKPKKESYDGTYIAVGISEDDRMGFDSVVECVTHPKPAIYTSWNYLRPNNQNDNERLKDDSYIHNKWVLVKNGTIFCDFTRDVNTKVKNSVFNLKNGPGYYILLAMGNLDPEKGGISYHHTRIASSEPILNSKSIVIHDPPKYSGV